MDLSPDERDLMTRVVLGEASADPDERAGVAWNVLNRVGKPGFANSIRDVITQRGQYNSLDNPNGPFYRSSRSAYADARDVVDSVAAGNTPDPTSGASHFLAASMPPEQRPHWAQGDGQQIGKTIFYGGKTAMSDDEQSQFLKDFRSKYNAPSPSDMSEEEQSQFLHDFRARQGTIPSQETTTAGPAAASSGPSEKEEEASIEQNPPENMEQLQSGLNQSARDYAATMTDPMSGAPMNSQLMDLIKQHPYVAAAGLGPPAAAVSAMGAAALATPPGQFVGRTLIKPLAHYAATAAGLGAGGLGILEYLHPGASGMILPKIMDLLTKEGTH